MKRFLTTLFVLAVICSYAQAVKFKSGPAGKNISHKHPLCSINSLFFFSAVSARDESIFTLLSKD